VSGLKILKNIFIHDAMPLFEFALFILQVSSLLLCFLFEHRKNTRNSHLISYLRLEVIESSAMQRENILHEKLLPRAIQKQIPATCFLF